MTTNDSSNIDKKKSKVCVFQCSSENILILFFRIWYKISTVTNLNLNSPVYNGEFLIPNLRVNKCVSASELLVHIGLVPKVFWMLYISFGKIKFDGGNNRRASSDLDESRHLQSPVTTWMPRVINWNAMSLMLLGLLNSISLSNRPKKYYATEMSYYLFHLFLQKSQK